jgi:hypothetical protein
MSTLVRLKSELDAAAHPPTESPEGLKCFREVWRLAVEEGKEQQASVILELREGLKVIATENERLEGTAVAAQNRALELEQARSAVEADLFRLKTRRDEELMEVRTALAESTTRTATTLQQLAECQAAHAAEAKALQADLAAAVRRAHELELQLVRATALLEAKGHSPVAAAQRAM